MKVLQINSTVNSGSTGRIAEDIGLTVMQAGHQSYIARADTSRPSQSEIITIGTKWDRKLHGMKTRLLDRHGFGSVNATNKLVEKITEINPDIIHLHNIHGYYLNIEILFGFLKEFRKPVVWTLHDCWPFTGHCSFFDAVDCYKWKTECNHCPNLKGYPASWGMDQSRRNFRDKSRIFNGVNLLQIVTPSYWLSNHASQSILSKYPVRIIHNGVDLEVFSPTYQVDSIRHKYGLPAKPIILGVASIWDKRKGMDDFIRLQHLISHEAQIVLVGLAQKQIKKLPQGITGISRTENVSKLANLYSAATAFVNPTYVDNFPTTNIEALACGTPVITYKTGGSPEAIDEYTGLVVEKGDITGLAAAIEQIITMGKDHYMPSCRERAERLFNKEDRFMDYLRLYESLLI